MVAKLKSNHNSLIIAHRFFSCENGHRKSLAGNLLMWSDLSLGPSFKVKRWFTAFGELSFQWIQFASVL